MAGNVVPLRPPPGAIQRRRDSMNRLSHVAGVPLSMWVIYDRPRDYPDGPIARRWEIGVGSARPTSEAIAGPLDMLRRHFHSLGLTVLARDPTDEPQIVESWI